MVQAVLGVDREEVDACVNEEHTLDAALYGRTGFLISRLHQMATALFAEEMSGLDLTPRQCSALIVIRARPGIDQASVAAALGKDWSTVGGIIDRLEQHKLIVRHPNPADRRARLLYLTRAGTELLAASEPGMAAVQRRMLDVLDPEERSAFLGLMAKAVWRYNEQSRFPVVQPPRTHACVEVFPPET